MRTREHQVTKRGEQFRSPGPVPAAGVTPRGHTINIQQIPCQFKPADVLSEKTCRVRGLLLAREHKGDILYGEAVGKSVGMVGTLQKVRHTAMALVALLYEKLCPSTAPFLSKDRGLEIATKTLYLVSY
jgi:hypothetical protein